MENLGRFYPSGRLLTTFVGRRISVDPPRLEV